MTFVPPTIPATVAPHEGPCQDWTTLTDARAVCGTADTEIDDDAFNFGIKLASRALWAATGRRYGLCQRTVRPCWTGQHGTGHGPYPTRYTPSTYGTTIGGGQMFTSFEAAAASTSNTSWTCGCSLPGLLLPGPIAMVEQVMINGAVLDPTAYKIKTRGHNARRDLIRIDGESWPCCNDLETDPAVVSTDTSCAAWSVTYWQGRPIPEEAQQLAAMLAEQFARLRCGGDCDNRMVPGLTKVARRGVVREFSTADMTNPDTGQTMTGLPAVDAWIAAVNPHRRTRSAAIVRPDDPERRRLWEWVDAA